jgi:hypothetical protein
MTRAFFIFFGTFAVGALIALVARAALFKPHAGHDADASSGGEYAAMVSNPLAPAAGAPQKAAPSPTNPTPAADPHANHGSTVAPAAPKPVNTVCAICGMNVDPKIPTMEYQGRTIGFGCRMCPPKFKAEPDRYGPYYLKNDVIKR